MPHSPRLYDGRLWVLESGRGEFHSIDRSNGKKTLICQLPGYLRGLAFFDRYAFIGLSKMREKDMFGGVPLEGMFPELQCAIYVIHIDTGSILGFIQYTKGIEELFDLHVLANTTRPHILGFEEDTVDGLYVLQNQGRNFLD